MPGISDIETDPITRMCTFKFKNKDLDLNAKLEEFGKSNTHIAGWSKVKPN